MELEQSGKSRVLLFNPLHFLNPIEALARSKRYQLKDDLQYLRDEYGLSVEMGRLNPSDHPNIAWIDKLVLPQAVRAVRVVREEVSKYPPEYLQFCGIKHFRLVRSFLKNRSGWPLGWAPYADGDYVYLGTNQNGNLPNKGTLHHEVFHISDYRGFDKRVSQSAENQTDKPVMEKLTMETYLASWLSLNPHGIEHYFMRNSKYNAYLRKHNIRDGATPIRGFARVYGLKDPWEDRATIAQLLMSQPKEAERRQRYDPMLRAKLNEVLTVLAERSEGRMSGKFLNDLMAGRVKEGYWT